MSKTQDTDGTWIAIEGLDGVGKTTLIAALEEEMRTSLGATDVVVLAAPPSGDRRFFDDLRSDAPHLRRAYYQLVNLANAQKAKALTAQGTFVISDRFVSSTLAFASIDPTDQEEGDAADLPAYILDQVDNVGRAPDLTVLLTLPEKTRLARMASRHGVPKTQEELAIEHSPTSAQVLAAYRSLIPTRIDIEVDASPPPHDIASTVCSHLPTMP